MTLFTMLHIEAILITFFHFNKQNGLFFYLSQLKSIILAVFSVKQAIYKAKQKTKNLLKA